MDPSKSITTGVGDKGMTRLYSGEEVSKDSPRCAACGDVDELVSALGLARCQVSDDAVKDVILDLQRRLFLVGSEIATERGRAAGLKVRIDASMVEDLDRRRKAAEESQPMPRDFIVPGGNVSAGHLDHARAIARRCERSVVAMARAGCIDNPHLLVWMNRLSDYLWLLARLEEGTSTPLKE